MFFSIQGDNLTDSLSVAIKDTSEIPCVLIVNVDAGNYHVSQDNISLCEIINLKHFLIELETCYTSLHGKACFSNEYFFDDGDFILNVTMGKNGHALVDGFLRRWRDGRDYTFTFGITTDQSFLATTISQLRAIVDVLEQSMPV
jgi:hypothetical protein